MKSTTLDVTSYIDEQPQEWQRELKKLRAVCRKVLSGYSESMAYGMPSYLRDGKTEVAFAKQAHYLSLYILKKPVLDGYRARLTGLSMGKGCIHYRKPDDIDWGVVTSLLSKTVASEAEIC